MSKWYEKYLQVYGKSVDEADAAVIDEIKSKLPHAEKPTASVVIIAHNEGKRILACLWSLVENACSFPFEICVVNNNSTDDTANILKKVGVTTFFEERKSPGYARQCGLDNARGKYHLCIDADTLYPPKYIETMVQVLERQNVVAAYGLWSFLPDKELSQLKISAFEWLRDLFLCMQDIKRPELNVRGMAFAFHTERARKYGFRTDIIRGEDGSLALNLKKEGRIQFVRSRKARPITDNSILKRQGSLSGAFLLRFKKAMKGLLSILHSQEHYQDKDDNLIR